jgi:hypothetical protein
VSTNDAPRAARPRAMAWPMPPVAPVTRAVASAILIPASSHVSSLAEHQRRRAAEPLGRVPQIVVKAGFSPAVNVNSSALLVILQANLEEWWDVKDREPGFADWGHRLT